jgi:hypothetical protein
MVAWVGGCEVSADRSPPLRYGYRRAFCYLLDLTAFLALDFSGLRNVTIISNPLK